MQLTNDSYIDIAEWLQGAVTIITSPLGVKDFYINTLEGEMHANLGDFIIKGVQGEFYPCKEDIFYQTYETASNELEIES